MKDISMKKKNISVMKLISNDALAEVKKSITFFV
jgi:hypothetical protein